MTRVLMVHPAAFDVVYAINPHMAANIGQIDRHRAFAQWSALVRVYRRLGLQVEVLPAVVGLPDLVFVANPVAAIAPGIALLSRMASPLRAPEVPIVGRWFRERGWRLVDPPSRPLEGFGDLRLFDGGLLGGWGFRTARGALDEVAASTGLPVHPLRLVDERLYHLDTALTPLRPGVCAWVPSAFDADSRARIASLFPVRVELPLDEAIGALAANGHAPDGRTFVVDAAATVTAERISRLGLQVARVDTSEFRKSGGSVFCLTQLIPE